MTGCWVVWHYDQSYSQGNVRVFKTEVQALRWAHKEAAGHNITFVPWEMSANEVEALNKSDGSEGFPRKRQSSVGG